MLRICQPRWGGGTLSPRHLLPVRSSPAPAHRPQVTSMAPWATLRCRTGHPPSSTGKGCHPTPAARGLFTTCSSDRVFPHETSQWPQSAAQLLRPCLGPSSRAPSSATGPHRPVPTTPALSAPLPSCPFALSLPSNHLLIPQDSAPEVASSRKLYLPPQAVRTLSSRSPQHPYLRWNAYLCCSYVYYLCDSLPEV